MRGYDFALLDSCCSYKYPTVSHIKYFRSKKMIEEIKLCVINFRVNCFFVWPGSLISEHLKPEAKLDTFKSPMILVIK